MTAPDDGPATDTETASGAPGAAATDDAARAGAARAGAPEEDSDLDDAATDEEAAPLPRGDDAPPATRLVAASTLRRAPRFRRFALVGVVVGAVAAALAAVLGPPGTTLGRGAIFLLLFLALGSAGALTGSLLAVLSDRRSLRDRADRS